MNALERMGTEDLQGLQAQIASRHAALAARGRKLDMTRGKPSTAQIDHVQALFDEAGDPGHLAADGSDVRNYGVREGLAEARTLFGTMLGAPASQTIVADTSSLGLMHDAIAWALLHGVPGSAQPWRKDEIAFLCPVPGYDRHFALAESFGIRLIPVALTGTGPDMDEVERLVQDPAVRGIWCVPRYSNPTGETYSDAVARRLATMRTAAPDFRLFWDDAYAVHHLTDERTKLADILDLCATAGHADRVFVFGSTSKITWPGACGGVFAGSPANVAWFAKHLNLRTTGTDRSAQLKHVQVLRDQTGIDALMAAHRALLAPKFAAVHAAFTRVLEPHAVGRWTQPRGGYFLTIDVPDGCARRSVALAAEAGIALTPAGATWPGGQDPHDRTLRIAPTYPTLDEVTDAADGIALSILLAAIEKELARRRNA